MLLKHPWLKSLSKPETITEEVEEGEEADQMTDAVGQMSLASGTEDSEIATWVKSKLTYGGPGPKAGGSTRPALHAAPLDSISPMGSPELDAK